MDAVCSTELRGAAEDCRLGFQEPDGRLGGEFHEPLTRIWVFRNFKQGCGSRTRPGGGKICARAERECGHTAAKLRSLQNCILD
ncbi:MAG: hypothetical protein BGO38_04290 [Cellulomonas sp. 73-145]|nr:MAG: hypothetical protein BGO38_04290 [Cellulomonas sp. 73-145]